jgi:WhiB family transcriptional regulator, redox-sensing transcriptional regulator
MEQSLYEVMDEFHRRFPLAACRGMGPDAFYPRQPDIVDPARAVCAQCPEKEPCGEWGIANERYGVWGGLSARRREQIRRQRHIHLPILSHVIPRSSGMGPSEFEMRVVITGRNSRGEDRIG